MANILYSWELGGGLGHLSVVHPVLQQLLAAGHRVGAVVCDNTHTDQFLGQLGIRVAHIQRPRIQAEQRIQPLRTFVHILYNSLLANERGCIQMSETIQTLVGDFRPDLIIADHSPATLMATRGAEIPTIVWGTGFTCPPPISPLPDWRAWLPKDLNALLNDEQRILRSLNAVLAKLGAPACDQVSDLYSQTRATMLTTYPELDHFDGRMDGNYVGTWTTMQGDEPQWPTGRGPKVFGYLKDTVELTLAIAALSELGYPTIIFSLHHSVDSPPTGLPRNIKLVSRPLDMVRIASEMDFAILNGTHTTVTQILRAGKPIVSLPLLLEQQLTGMRIEKLKAGLVVLQPTVEKVAMALTKMNDEQGFCGARAFAQNHGDASSDENLRRVVEQIERLAD